MADHDPTPGASIADPQLDLKKRARRRLVGASALALLAIIVLPMVMDAEPRPNTTEIQIRIPSQEPGSNIVASPIEPRHSARSHEHAQPRAEAQPHTPATSAPAPAMAATEPASSRTAAPGPDKPAGKSADQATSTPHHGSTPPPAQSSEPVKAAEKQLAKTDREPAQAEASQERTRALALLNDERWIIQLGAYKDQGNVRVLQQKVKELGYPVITEQIDTPAGPRTRVRVGPFHNRADADQAHARLKKIAAGGPTGGSMAQLK